MRNFIRRSAHWLSLLLTPGTGTRRAGRGPAHSPRPAHPTAVPEPEHLPLHRSPYGLDHPLDGAATRLVRPYLAAHEREVAQQQRRRLALVLAADFGIDLDRHLIGAGEVAV
ncbi:hypothetical protein [Streptomyces tailanensis]|uniref:hypothetical protein n=1 Tax=Streptomyces tailanensis TaxID=2569858 RepID=UPI00122DD8CC|nr:hypothetical protein [Streptomyces tailanensis]